MNKYKQIIKKLLYIILPHKYIIFESVPDCGDNSKAVFDEMIHRGWNKKYKLIWLISKNNSRIDSIPNVRYISSDDWHAKFYITLAKCFICCNGFLYSDNPSQKTFFLTHGMYVKKPTSYYCLPDQIQYCLSSSEQMKQIQATALGAAIDKMVPLGYPRNDVLTMTRRNLHGLFTVEFRKLIVWYPTFRQHCSGMETGSKHAVPIIWDAGAAKIINDYAKDREILIVLKPHFAQDMSKIQRLNLSNILIINDDFFIENKITSYEFIGNCDALLTDYSSVYFDYTLCDKPIGLIWEDYNEYEVNPGFVLDMDYYMKGGVKIYNVVDFIQFIDDVSRGKDILASERRAIRDISNYSTDGKSSCRVVDFIERQACL